MTGAFNEHRSDHPGGPDQGADFHRPRDARHRVPHGGSVAIYDAKDFSCGLFAPDSRVVAQSEDIGSHVVPLPWSVRSAMEKFGHDLAPGDVILSNDPVRAARTSTT